MAALGLEAIAAQGEMRLSRGEVGEAVAVFSTLSAGICAGYEMIWDEESESVWCSTGASNDVA